MTDFLSQACFMGEIPHIMAVISMAGLFYLAQIIRLSRERGQTGEPAASFQIMEEKLLRMIMNPAMVVTWIAGLALS